tara:strand:+ start:9591 stop:9821 length:231 start_codon:yes stop_codon:yes gene_type:complete
MEENNIIELQKIMDEKRVASAIHEGTDEEFDALVREMLKKDFKPRLSLSEKLFMFTAITALLGGISILGIAGWLAL